MGPFSQPQWPSWAYSGMADPFSAYAQFSNYPGMLADSLEAYQNHHNRLVQQHQMSRATESKPRLSKEEVEILEAEFQKNHKPSSNTKKSLAESMRVDNARINNWFQNRRAREKKENNIREYEAKQRQEKEKAEAEEGSQPDKSRQRDLVASSAPFPEPAGNKQRPEVSRSPSEQSLPDPTQEATDISLSGDSDIASPLAMPQQELSARRMAGIADGLRVKSEQDDDLDACAMSDNMDDYFAMSDSCLNPSFDEATAADQQFMSGISVSEGSPEDFDPKSPEPIDIATRRNRRPAPLAINARSQSYTSRTSDYARRSDHAISMRRVSSATGSGRVRKSVSTPRSPFFDRNTDNILRRASPNAAGRGSAAPPTPDTPVALQSASADSALSAYGLGSKYTPPELIISDPTLRTPPSTPGFTDGLFNLSSGYDMGISEETLIAPGMGRVHGRIDMIGNAPEYPNYMSTSQGSTQSLTSLFPTQQAPAYYGFMGANTGYNWSDISPSTASTTSNPQQRYMSLSASNLHHVDN